jgi:hypothetical protein
MSATDEMLALVDRLAVEMGIGRQGDWMPSLRFSPAQTRTLQAIIDQARRDAAAEIRAADFGDPYYVGFGQSAAADLIDPDVEGDSPADTDGKCAACTVGGHSCGA